jgi:hypothetical protein
MSWLNGAKSFPRKVMFNYSVRARSAAITLLRTFLELKEQRTGTE